MSQRRTVDLLPEIFRTDTNKKFLAATLDQLTQEPAIKKTRGYVGRRVGPGVNPGDSYVTEPTAERANYQLEPGVIFLKPDTNVVEDALTFPGLLDSLALQGADVSRVDRLFDSQYYAWDPFCDLDKFTNYSQYYWLPEGPDSVDITGPVVPQEAQYTVSRSADVYSFSGVPGFNPMITLARGGSYSFTVDQPGHKFWIQSEPGITGTMQATPNISSRGVLGVGNNGAEQGTVTFDVPLATAQDFFFDLDDGGNVDLLTTTLQFDQINNIYVSQFLAENPGGVDGITNLDGRTLVFATTSNQGWQSISLADNYDNDMFDATTPIDDPAVRYGVWLIRYQDDGSGNQFIVLASTREINTLSRIKILFGKQWSTTTWYKNSVSYFEQIPLLTAPASVLYYQDGTNPDLVYTIKLVDNAGTNALDIDEIIGCKTYVSPNGVILTNGLKIQIRGPSNVPEYQNLEFYVEGVGTGPGAESRVGFIDGEAYFGPFHVHQGQKMTGISHVGTLHQFIYDTLAESLVNFGRAGPVDAALSSLPQAGATVGNGIKLLPVTDFVTPETYTKSSTVPYDSLPYDQGGFDSTLNAPLVPDYITMNRSAQDLNPWSRSNRWFHIDVIRATATYNDDSLRLDNEFRAKRPIIEFRANLRLFNFGTQGKQPVNIIDFAVTDALSNVNGQISYGLDGYELLNGSLVIFAADRDPQVRNKIYRVEFIDPDGSPNSPKIINLVSAVLGDALINQTVVSLSGVTQQGRCFWFDGVNWIAGQQKTGVNQAPLFDVFDSQAHSLSDRAVYPSSNFQGTKLLSYALGSASSVDLVLGIPLRYLSIDNVGDIVFENHFYTDTWLFTKDSTSVTENISVGFVHQYIDRVTFSDLIGWQSTVSENVSRQVFRFIYDGLSLILDIPVILDSVLLPLQIFVNGVYVDPDQYTVTVSNGQTVVVMNQMSQADNGTVIEAQALSDQASAVGFYQVPLNLENNALNVDSATFTLGTIRSHYNSIGQNLRDISGPINGANNSRDLGNILPFGNLVIQNSSPLTLASVFMRRQEFNIFNALSFNSQEYSKYKAQLLDLAAKGDFVNNTATQILDACMQEISLNKTETSPFYWSDMIPAGETYIENSYTFTNISTSTFDTVQTYDFNIANYRGLLVFLNGTLLTINYDYTVGDDSATVDITAPLSVGDMVVIREYPSTYGSYVPNTPTKLGMYPAFRPEIYLDTTYVNPTRVIRGHDGSITVTYGDARDQILLEFETRIFDNLKVDSNNIPLTAAEVVPGQFRDTDYTLAEINEILGQDFLAWVGWNKLDYTTQTYLSSNEFTYNYSQSSNRLTGQPLLGAWHGIYDFFYDTVTPTARPWEMLGFSQAPSWWETTYGPAPYTSGNMVLWEDLEAGFVNDPIQPYFRPEYARPGLSKVIPAASEGELLSPLNSVVGQYDATSFRRSWTFGDDAPTEYAWRSSSSYPFAIMRLLALTKPAKFFSLFVDRDRYTFSDSLGQYLWDARYRLDAKTISPLYGQGVSRASYIDWIIDYNKYIGVDSTNRLTRILANLDLRLTWRMAAFSDKRYLKVYTERSTPNSLNSSLLLPDESYQLLLYQNQPFSSAQFSSVIIQLSENGYAVLGYSALQPYFEILSSNPNGLLETISAGGSSANVPIQYSDNVVSVPYGYVFNNRTAVCDFLYSYGELLRRQGWTFEGSENGIIMDWRQMAQEFLYWSNQGWVDGSLINLNPGATKVSITQLGSVAESIVPPRADNLVLNQNRQPIRADNLVINRLDNTFEINVTSNETINYLKLRFTAYEHLMVFDNRSIFADLIYDPGTGARQSRVLVSGLLSADWNGTVNAPGFVLNQNNVPEWQANRVYTKGEIVLFKDQYWAASTIIQPARQFDYTLWLKSDYDEVMVGLLPNAANSSDQLANAYSIYTANLENEVDLFSYGLIGFRPRKYMQALNLDDTSQVQLYQQFLGTKGTRRSAELFSLADLGKETAKYDIYEIWSILRGTYGANANRNYFELQLNQALLTSDPSLIEVILPEQFSQADQTVLLQNIWKSSYKISSPEILPTISAPITDTALPTAGYVNLDDVDITLFSLDDPSALNASLDTIGVGTLIWVAKKNAYDWNVYHVQRVPGDISQVSNNLDGLSLATFTRQHGLLAGNYVIIRFFADVVNGVYRVISVPDLYSVLIEYTFTGTQNSITGEGVGFTLTDARVAQASDISTLPYVRDIRPGARVWVDDDSFGRWYVLQKNDIFQESDLLELQFPDTGDLFGQSVSQGMQNQTAAVGAPGHNPEGSAESPGAVYAFFKADTDQYELGQKFMLDAANVSGLGNSVDVGGSNWLVAGASASNNGQGYVVTLFRPDSGNSVELRQLLVAPDLEFGGIRFGDVVVISQDERWMYIGTNTGNRVYAYALVPVQLQTATYITDGTTSIYNWSDHIVLTAPASANPEQLVIALGDQALQYNIDWALSGNNIALNSIPAPGLTLRISRRSIFQLDQQIYRNVSASATSGSGTGALFTINRVRGDFTVNISSPGIDYETGDILTIKGIDIGSGSRAATSMVNAVSYTIVSAGDSDFTLVGAPDNNPGTLFTATGPTGGTGTVAENLILTVTQIGPTAAAILAAGLDTATVNTTSGMVVGQILIKLSGAGDFAVGATITDISGNIITLSIPHTTSGYIQFYTEPGAISSFTQTGSGVADTSVFSLAPYLATATNIWSFSVAVNSEVYRPEIDYDYNSDSAFQQLDLVFNTVPPAGASIVVSAQSYYQFVDIIEIPQVTTTSVSVSGTVLTVTDTANIVPGMLILGAGFANEPYVTEVITSTQLRISVAPEGAPSGPVIFRVSNFGKSISSSTDGKQIMIGCTGSSNSPGQIFVFDRSVQTFNVQTAGPAQNFVTDQNLTGITNVTVNGQFLLDQDLNIGGEFEVTGSNTVQVTAELAAGDLVTINTNQFTLIQNVVSANPFESAAFGYATDLCPNNCSLYVGAPFDGSVLPKAGSIEYHINQSRVFGTITSNIANPVLVPTQTIRINEVVVELYATDINGDAQAPTVDSLVQDIQNAQDVSLLQSTDAAVRARYRGLSNVQAAVVPDLLLIADGIIKVFAVGTIYSASYFTVAPVTVVYIDDVLQTVGTDYSYDNNTRQITFQTAPGDQSVIRVVSGRLTLMVKNPSAAPALSKLRLAPGVGSIFQSLGFETYTWAQTVTSPVPQDYAFFGQSLVVSDTATAVIVGAPNTAMILPELFDSGRTTFDANSTNFFDVIANSGSVYVYDLFPSSSASLSNPPQLAFGQQITDATLATDDRYGQSLDYTNGTLLIGQPGWDRGDSQSNFGVVKQWINPDRSPAWNVLRLQSPSVNTANLNTVFLYDLVTGQPRLYLDYFDPLQGRMLGVIQQNLDFTGAIDPAQYNVGTVNNRGQRWGQQHVGQIWWDTRLTRFIDPNQDDPVYASRRWGQLFPGSTPLVYQWIESSVPPSQFIGPGIPRSLDSYVVSASIDQQGIFTDQYYFWVAGIRTVARSTGKTLSVETITRYIENPQSSGISYIAPISPSTIAIYNSNQYISAQDTVLHVEFDRVINDDAVYVEYQLIPQDRPDAFLNDALYRKLLDSFCGVDTAGNAVPDANLPPADRFGVDFRPRQSMFVNRFLALQNYLQSANTVLRAFPISEIRDSALLNSSDPEPSTASGEWNKRVIDYAELTYQSLNQVDLGYRYLVVSDSTNNGLWTIYEVIPGDLPGSRTLLLVRVQNYDTRLYWSFIDWYAPGYDPSTRILLEVPRYSSLTTITVPAGSSVKVTANAQGKWEIYRLTNGDWQRVALRDGTLEFSADLWDYTLARFGFDSEVFDAQYFDQSPVVETRQILRALNEQILTGDLALERNRLLILMFNYILTELIAPTWLTKTSLIDVDHVIRNLQPFQIYRQDNQDFVQNYIKEVKPYHTQIREFNLIYQGSDTYQGTVTDFDVPAYWNAQENLFVSPVLDDTGTLSTTSSTPSTSEIWQDLPWNQWYNNYLLSVAQVIIVDGGLGYTSPPEVLVSGAAASPATMTARINSAGQVIAIIVDDGGVGYANTAVLILVGGGGSGAKAVAVMNNDLVRSLWTTIKYDRYQYNSTILPWQPGTNYDNGTLVRYDDRVWSASSEDSTGVETATFDPTDWTLVPAGDLSGVDRTMGYYAPGVDQPGLDLALLISGVDYPGVQVDAPDFNENTGFDVGNYDINTFDNISFGPEGQPTYDPAILDAIYESEFTDPYLGVLPAPAYAGNPPNEPNAIVVDGGEFVDTYSSHAPEELVPGAIFDTLDLRVFTTPGADWLDDGHGFAMVNKAYIWTASSAFSFNDLVPYPYAVEVYNRTIGIRLLPGTHYTTDWLSQEVTVYGGTSSGDVIDVLAISLGGGNQIYQAQYAGTIIGNSVVIPVQSGLIEELVIFVNGVQTTAFTFAADQTFQTKITFSTAYGSTDFIGLTAIAATQGQMRSWSTWLTQYEIADGSTLAFVLDNSLQGTNSANLIVEKNGIRARPAEGLQHIADGSSLTYFIPDRGGYNQALIADNEVDVWINNQPLVYGVDFILDPYVGGARTITLSVLPAAGAVILVSVDHAADYYLNGNVLIFRSTSPLIPLLGDVLSFTTFNDTSQQDLLTSVFVGPTTTGVQVSEGYDTTDYDLGNVTGASGSYDYAVGTIISLNQFDIGRNIADPSRLIVTLDGEYIFSYQQYVLDGSKIVILGAPINANSVVAITSFTESLVPGPIAFRIFQDMRSLKTTYRITESTTTALSQDLSADADVIHVVDATALSEPDLPLGIFGVITIDGERITYRHRDTGTNFLSGLRRGTAGTAAAPHVAGTAVYDLGRGNLLQSEYQDTVIVTNNIGNGSATGYTAQDINLAGFTLSQAQQAVRVAVGGILQQGGYEVTSVSPVTIQFDIAPASGYQVSIRVIQSQSYYQPGSGTASDGIPLQEQNTSAGLFIRGGGSGSSGGYGGSGGSGGSGGYGGSGGSY